MSRSVTLTMIFESELAQARKKYEDFANEVQSKVLKIPAELVVKGKGGPGGNQGLIGSISGEPIIPAPPAGGTTFGGQVGSVSGASFVPAPIISQPPRTSGVPSATPIQQPSYVPQVQLPPKIQSTPITPAYVAQQSIEPPKPTKQIEDSARGTTPKFIGKSIGELNEVTRSQVQSLHELEDAAEEARSSGQRKQAGEIGAFAKSIREGLQFRGIDPDQFRGGQGQDTIKLTVDTSDATASVKQLQSDIQQVRQVAQSPIPLEGAGPIEREQPQLPPTRQRTRRRIAEPPPPQIEQPQEPEFGTIEQDLRSPIAREAGPRTRQEVLRPPATPVIPARNVRELDLATPEKGRPSPIPLAGPELETYPVSDEQRSLARSGGRSIIQSVDRGSSLSAGPRRFSGSEVSDAVSRGRPSLPDYSDVFEGEFKTAGGPWQGGAATGPGGGGGAPGGPTPPGGGGGPGAGGPPGGGGGGLPVWVPGQGQWGPPPPGLPTTNNAAIGYGAGAFPLGLTPNSLQNRNPYGYAFGFIRPLAAGYILTRGISSLVSRVREIQNEDQDVRNTNQYGTLSEQVTNASNFAESERTRFFASRLVAPFLNDQSNVLSRYSNRLMTSIQEQGLFSTSTLGALFGQGGTQGRFTEQSDVDVMAEARNVFQQQQISRQTQIETQRTQAQTGMIGLSGFALEQAGAIESARVSRQELQSRLGQGSGEAAKELQNAFKAVDGQLSAHIADISKRLNMQSKSDREESVALGYEGAGQGYFATMQRLSTQQDLQLEEWDRSTKGLSEEDRRSSFVALRGRQVADRDAINATLVRQADKGIAQQDFETKAAAETRLGYWQIGAEDRVRGEFNPITDPTTGKITGFRGEDKSNPKAREIFDSTLAAYTEAMAGATVNVSQATKQIQVSTDAARLIANRDPYGAQIRRIEGAFEVATQGMDDSPAYKILKANRDANLAAAQAEREDQLDITTVGLMNERAGLKRGLARDYAGQQLENLASGFDQRQLQLRDQDQVEQRVDTLKNEKLAVQQFQQSYLDSFRGEAFDTRLFDTTNARDKEDPGAVLGEIKDKLDEINTTLQNIGVSDTGD